MKTLVTLLAVLPACLLTSCTAHSVFLQELQTEGPQSKPPLYITNNSKAGDLRIVPKISYSNSQKIIGRTQGHSNVTLDGTYRVDTVSTGGVVKYMEREGVNTHLFSGRNFVWDAPDVTASLSAEYLVTDQISFVLGGNYSSRRSEQYFGAIAGAGFLFEGKNIAARIDIGAQWTTAKYDVHYVVTTPPFSFVSREMEVEFFHDKGKETFVNSYTAVTFNSKVQAWPVQGFLQLAINRQTLVFLERRAKIADRSSVLQSGSFFFVTPGLYLDISPKTRIVAGLHLGDETELLEGEPGVVLVPFLQFEFTL